MRGGKILRGVRTPSAKLDLQPGELVGVRKYPQILATLDQDWHNFGMYFDGEQVPFCDGTYLSSAASNASSTRRPGQ